MLQYKIINKYFDDSTNRNNFSFIQSPPKGATIPYRPKPQVNGPVILANGQAYTIQGNFAVPTEQVNVKYLIKPSSSPSSSSLSFIH